MAGARFRSRLAAVVTFGLLVAAVVAPAGPATAAAGAEPLAELDRLLAAGDAAAAERRARALLAGDALEPRHLWRVHQRLGVALLALDRWQEAVTSLEQSLAAAPQQPATHLNLGRAWRRLGRPGRAVGSFEIAVALAPDEHAWRLEYAEVLLALGIRRDALQQIHMARAGCEDCRSALRAEANFHLTVGDAAAAASVLRRLHETGPDPQLRLMLAGALWEGGDAAAVVALLEGVPQGELAPAELMMLVQADRLLGRLERSLAWVADGTFEPDGGDQRGHTFWAIVAEICLAGQEEEAALTAIDRALALAPQTAVYHHNRAAVLAALGRDDDARQALAEARRLDPSLAEGQP